MCRPDEYIECLNEKVCQSKKEANYVTHHMNSFTNLTHERDHHPHLTPPPPTFDGVVLQTHEHRVQLNTDRSCYSPQVQHFEIYDVYGVEGFVVVVLIWWWCQGRT